MSSERFDQYSTAPGRSVFADPKRRTFCIHGCLLLQNETDSRREYSRPKEALEWGYNPCTACRPMDPPLPQGIDSSEKIARANLYNAIADDPEYRIKAQALIDSGIDPDRLSRIYQKYFSLTFQDYLRMRRINHRFGPESEISDSGNSDVIRRYGADGRTTAAASGELVLTRIDTPLGPMLAAASQTGLCLLEFSERRMMETQISRLEKFHTGTLYMGSSRILDQTAKELAEFFSGSRKDFSVPLDPKGTDFQMAVWNELQRIPYGEFRTYAAQAAALGNPKAVRAVARANGDNPIGIIVPCHRVLGADGSMTGYGGRIWRKEALLALEAKQSELFQ